jgi:(1->4)-alpha-D-glucan 1-alpha-D-glucosylmutase
VYAPLASRNEVGGDPGVPVAGAVERLHRRLAERAARHPRALNATNTHDTKRSADVRARLDALSENPASWERRLRQWRRHHRTLQTLVAGRLAPSRTTDNFIYQALVGLWPQGVGVRASDDASWLASLKERLTAYIQKAVREAKVSTSWTDPDAEYEKAIETFIAGMLDRGSNARFLHDVEQFVASIAPQGRWNALARLVVHLTAPGVPDIYQGDELFFRALVDPDNRRPVDWAHRERALGEIDAALDPEVEIDAARLHQWCARPEDDGLKLYLTARLLRLRARRAELVTHGSYTPLAASGLRADRVFAFLRAHRDDALVVAVPRLTCGFGGDLPIREAWGDTRLRLPEGTFATTWRCEVGGQVVQSVDGWLTLADLTSRLPVAVLAPRR